MKNPKFSRSRGFLGDILIQCTACGRVLTGNEIDCPGCFVQLKSNIELQLEQLDPYFDSVLHKHHPEAQFDYPGGFADGEDEEYEP